MKKRALTLCLILILSFSIFVPFAFAEAECEHNYEDDGDCTTPAICTLCGQTVISKEAHNFDKPISYSYNENNFLSNGAKIVACSNNGCAKTTKLDAKPLVNSLGYSLREYEKNDCTYYSLTSSYIFNENEIKSYANSIGKEYQYGIICFIPDVIGNDQPIDSNGDPDITVLMAEFTDTNGVCDLTLPSIIDDSANDEFVFAAFIRFGKDVYYIQSGKIFTDYKNLGIATCSLVLDKLSSAQ